MLIEMAGDLSSSFNPWSTGGAVAGIHLGDPQSGLVVARRHGIVPTLEGDSTGSVSSVRMLSTLQEMSSLSSELHEVELELRRQTLDKETADLVHQDVQKARLSKINSLLDHFTSVSTNKETIVARLQSKAADNSLTIEAPYQRHTTEVLSSLGTFVSNLHDNCDKAMWASSLDMDNTSLSKKTAEVAQDIVQCRDDSQTCQQLHEVLART